MSDAVPVQTAPAEGKSVKPLRFGVQAFDAKSATEWTNLARRAEELGFSTLHAADHYMGPGRVEEESHHPIQELAAMPALCFAAAATEKLRVGSRMFCIDYHVPAALAKEAATLDLLSGGRFELGLGAGWIKAEYDGMGIGYDRIGVRISRLEEVLDLMLQQFGGDQIQVDGEHLNVSGYSGLPIPTTPGGPPITIGGGGKRILSLAARAADVVSVNWTWRNGTIDQEAMGSGTSSEMAKKIGWVRAAAEAAGRWEDIEIEVSCPFLYVTDDVSRTCDKVAQILAIDPDQVLDYPHALVGSIDGICDQIEERRELYGVNYVTVHANVFGPDVTSWEEFAPVVDRLTGT